MTQSLPLKTPFGSVRRAAPTDTAPLLHMIAGLAAFHGDTPALTPETLTRDAFGPHPWLTLLVADTGQALLGYAALCPMAQLQFGARGMDIHHFFIRDPARGQGVGTALIEACQAQATQLSCSVLTVGTHPGNPAAAAFYEARGFTRRNTTPPRFSMRLG